MNGVKWRQVAPCTGASINGLPVRGPMRRQKASRSHSERASKKLIGSLGNVCLGTMGRHTTKTGHRQGPPREKCPNGRAPRRTGFPCEDPRRCKKHPNHIQNGPPKTRSGLLVAFLGNMGQLGHRKSSSQRD